MILAELPEDFFYDCSHEGMSTADIILGTAHRLFRQILPEAAGIIVDRVAKLPLTANEVRSRVYKRFHKDERDAIKIMEGLGSEACRTVGKLMVGRPLI